MSRKGEGIKIDGEKLKHLICKQDTVCNAGLKAGYSRSFFQNSIERGCIFKNGIVALELLYGIKLEDYEIKEQLPERRNDDAVNTDELRRAIASGIVGAVRCMIKTGELHEALVEAIKQAFND